MLVEFGVGSLPSNIGWANVVDVVEQSVVGRQDLAGHVDEVALHLGKCESAVGAVPMGNAGSHFHQGEPRHGGVIGGEVADPQSAFDNLGKERFVFIAQALHGVAIFGSQRAHFILHNA